MRTDALVAKVGGLLLALCALSAPAWSAAQDKSARAAADFPLQITDDRGPATGVDSLDSLSAPANTPTPSAGTPLGVGSYTIPNLTDRENFSAALQLVVVLTVLSLAPAILIMMTCFTRIIIVLSLLRQALGTQQLPPNQVLIGLAMFMTFLVMGPTWRRVNGEALKPYLDGAITQQTALERAEVPVREFMILQVERAGNQDDVLLFHQFTGVKTAELRWNDVSTLSLVPGFMLSELKTAFLMGFKVYLPFLIIDIVISTILISMGMMMLPPVMISLPFKLLLFVLVDGWHLITQGLMGSFGVT